MMENLIPKEFVDMLAGLTLSFSIVFLLLSSNIRNRDYFLKVACILAILSIALFAKNIWSWLSVIFIIGTTITELDFLQNIAAIIRGSETYFKYKKEFTPEDEVERSIKNEIEYVNNDSNERSAVEDEISFPLIRSKLKDTQLYIVAEELAFRYLERKFNNTISRHVSYPEIGGYIIKFDGVIEDKKKNTVFELIIPRSPVLAFSLFQRNTPVFHAFRSYEKLLKKTVELKIYIIADSLQNSDLKRIKDKAAKIAETTRIEAKYTIEILTFHEIGIN